MRAYITHIVMYVVIEGLKMEIFVVYGALSRIRFSLLWHIVCFMALLLYAMRPI